MENCMLGKCIRLENILVIEAIDRRAQSIQLSTLEHRTAFIYLSLLVLVNEFGLQIEKWHSIAWPFIYSVHVYLFTLLLAIGLNEKRQRYGNESAAKNPQRMICVYIAIKWVYEYIDGDSRPFVAIFSEHSTNWMVACWCWPNNHSDRWTWT